MNDPALMVSKLDELIGLAREADTGFEKAAVFAAVRAVDSMFRSRDGEFTANFLGKLGQARWHIAAAVGYDITNGHDAEAHISWAMGAVSTMEDLIKRGAHMTATGVDD